MKKWDFLKFHSNLIRGHIFCSDWLKFGPDTPYSSPYFSDVAEFWHFLKSADTPLIRTLIWASHEKLTPDPPIALIRGLWCQTIPFWRVFNRNLSIFQFLWDILVWISEVHCYRTFANFHTYLAKVMIWFFQSFLCQVEQKRVKYL